MTTLKEEWMEKIKKIDARNIYLTGGGFFSVRTEFYKAPDEIRNDREMCLKVLLESDEHIFNVPVEIRTTEFLEELIEKGYKGNLLFNKMVWEEEDFPFIKKYLSNFYKNNKPVFNTNIRHKGIFANREMVLSLVKEDSFYNRDFLLEYYRKDKEIMFAVLDNHPNDIIDMLKSIKNAYFKDKTKIINVLNAHSQNYNCLPEKFQIIAEVIDYALEKNPDIFHHLPQEIIKNREEVFRLIKKHTNIQGNNVPLNYRGDYEIAKFMVERRGSNFQSFDFRNDDDLIKLSAKTYNSTSHIPLKPEYEDIIKEIVLDLIFTKMKKI